jgi:predicted DNA-binding transcriptional regulator AlpA
MKLIKFEKVSEICGGLCKSTIYRHMEKRGFPKPRQIGGRVLWVEEEVGEWLLEQVNRPYEPQPVAIPKQGKRRGRHAKKDSNGQNFVTTSRHEAVADSNVEKFKMFMLEKGILPPNEIVDDGKPHLIDGGANKSYYMFKNGYPAAGACGSLERQIKAFWIHSDGYKKLKPKPVPNHVELFRNFVNINGNDVIRKLSKA